MLKRWKKRFKITKRAQKAFSMRNEKKPNLFTKLKQFVERRTSIKISSSEQEHKVNALASGAEEGRD